MDPGTVKLLVGTAVLMAVILTIALGRASFTDKRVLAYFKLVLFIPSIAIGSVLLWFRLVPEWVGLPPDYGQGSIGAMYFIGTLVTAAPPIIACICTSFDDL